VGVDKNNLPCPLLEEQLLISFSNKYLQDKIRLNPSCPPFNKGRNCPSLEKRGQRRFSQYIFSIAALW
jgi:hypothetical protein